MGTMALRRHRERRPPGRAPLGPRKSRARRASSRCPRSVSESTRSGETRSKRKGWRKRRRTMGIAGTDRKEERQQLLSMQRRIALPLRGELGHRTRMELGRGGGALLQVPKSQHQQNEERYRDGGRRFGRLPKWWTSIGVPRFDSRVQGVAQRGEAQPRARTKEEARGRRGSRASQIGGNQ